MVTRQGPRPDDLAARATTTTVLARVARTPDGGVEQALTTYATDEGLWLLQGRRAPEPVATLQIPGRGDLAAVTRRLVTLDQDTPRCTETLRSSHVTPSRQSCARLLTSRTSGSARTVRVKPMRHALVCGVKRAWRITVACGRTCKLATSKSSANVTSAR